MHRVAGLDAIRMILAAWVVLNHVAPPPILDGIDTSTQFGWVLKAGYGVCINGQAAVIGFFVISGFCIHYPYRHTPPGSVGAFYLRRYIRVGVPFGVIFLLTLCLPQPWRYLERGIFWSVYAELIYYTLYPFFLILHRKFGWNLLIATSFILTPLPLFAEHPGGNYHAVGDHLAWVIGLPCWLMGCKLADRLSHRSSSVTRSMIWRWRLTVWLASVGCYILRFHTPIKHYHTLNFFAILVYFWLFRELQYFSTTHPPQWLERAGSWSYSLYLTHFFGAYLYSVAQPPNLGYFLNWVVLCSVVFTCAYGFALLVELPAHRLARAAAVWWTGRPSSELLMGRTGAAEPSPGSVCLGPVSQQ